ncbi:MAG: DnaB-like helicase C-terminal domain-containing protein [Lachnoclostridium sp.]|nr:DnaB-like helicase C-terminal domain-containing protein [Lachnoclostridium sp.]
MSDIAEKNLIGSVLIDPDTMKDISGILNHTMFTDVLASSIFQSMQHLYDIGERITVISIVNHTESVAFPREDILEYMKDATEKCIHSAGAVGYAEQIKNDWLCREVTGLMMVTQVDIKPSNVNDRISNMINQLEKFKAGQKSAIRSMKDIVRDNRKTHFADIEKKRYYTGLDKIDNATGGLEGGDIVVIAGRPATGKSALSDQIALSMAADGLTVLIYNLEMKETQVYERLISHDSGIDFQRVRLAKNFLGDEEEKFIRSNDKLESMNIHISSNTVSVGDIQAEVSHMDVDCIIVDYLQLVKPNGRRESRTLEVSEIMHSLKAIAMNKNIPVIVLSQLNRNVDGRADKEPNMGDLRECGDIENDASIIILLWNITPDGKYKGIKLDKNRNGYLVKSAYEFIGSKMNFKESDIPIRRLKGFQSDEENPF